MLKYLGMEKFKCHMTNGLIIELRNSDTADYQQSCLKLSFIENIFSYNFFLIMISSPISPSLVSSLSYPSNSSFSLFRKPLGN